MKNKSRRLLSTLLAVVMVFGLFAAQARLKPRLPAIPSPLLVQSPELRICWP